MVAGLKNPGYIDPIYIYRYTASYFVKDVFGFNSVRRGLRMSLHMYLATSQADPDTLLEAF